MFVANRLVFLSVILIVSVFNNISNADFEVKTVYLIPTDSVDNSEELNLNDIMKSVQTTYRDEMNRHGFGNKTFDLETDKDGRVVVHKVKGDRNKFFYNTVDNFFLVQGELENKGYNNRQSIYAIVMAGMNSVFGSAAGLAASYASGAWFNNDNYYGYCIVIESTQQDTERIISHELGHTFGFAHIVLDNSNDLIMGSAGDKLAFHEARWLSRNQYFNHKWTHNFGPEIVGFHGAKNQNDGKIRITADISDPDGLFQSYGFVTTPTPAGYAVIGVNFYDGNMNVKIDFDDIDRYLLTASNEIWIQLMDSHGNWRYHHPKIYKLPDQEEFEDHKKYLTIRNKHDINSLTPINNENEWFGWENAGVFEKIPDTDAPKLPEWYFDFPNMHDWTHWFYSHASSRFIYDISNKGYNRFESHFYMPNPCGGGATMKVVCFADDIEIYHSELLSAPAAQNKHFQVNIPENTSKFTIQVTDAQDGIFCDHFVFGEPVMKIVTQDEINRIDINEDMDENQVEPPEDIICEGCEIDIDPRSVNGKFKLATSWGVIKSR